MNNSLFNFPTPANEPVFAYEKGSKERELIEKELKKIGSEEIEIPLIIGGKEVRTGKTAKVVCPHDHKHVLATYHKATEKEVEQGIKAALEAKKQWMNMSWIDRSSIMLKAAELIAKRYRYVMNASTMLGQSKTVFQAEIDSACETIDFLRYNSAFASQIYSDQPLSTPDQLNRMEYRPLEGFVFAVTPFNFTSIAANLNMSPILMGNTTVWKPATTSLLSNYYLMQVYKEAGIPDGVINFMPGPGSAIGAPVFGHRDFAGVHFTGSNSTFNNFWKTIANNMDNYKSYPKIVGETGGKDFIVAHNSANPLEVATAIVRGAFEFQGQKCSAASRAYIPESMWKEVRKHIEDMVSKIKMGDVTDFSNFMNAVIDEASFDMIMGYVNDAKKSKECEIVTGGNGDKSVGYFIEPTVIKTTNPNYATMQVELFGPVITIYVYPDKEFEKTLEIVDNTSPYGLTGAIFATDRYVVAKAFDALRYAAGNFYINDKPTGAMVGMQPFGGSRGSGTNDKAGSLLNLLRWVNPRAIKETYVPARDFTYPFMK